MSAVPGGPRQLHEGDEVEIATQPDPEGSGGMLVTLDFFRPNGENQKVPVATLLFLTPKRP